MWPKFYASLIDNIKLRVPSPYITNFNIFPSAPTNCSAGCATAATLEWLDIDIDIDIFSKQTVSLKHVLR